MNHRGDTDVGTLLRLQGEWAASHGSPMYGVLLARASEDYDSGGIVADLLAPYARARRGDAVPLRLMGALHRLALSGIAPELAAQYPSTGGTFDARTVWPIAAAALSQHHQDVAQVLTRPPQTNEPGRGVALVGALAWFRAVTGRATPFRINELGSSAGLLLRSEAFAAAGMYDGSLPPWWSDRTAPIVTTRLGCDPDPIDPTGPDGRLTLMQYVWPDDGHRMDRLRSALDIAEQVPAKVRRESASTFLPSVDLSPGTTTVVWHSVMWRYVPERERQVILAERARLGSAATPDAPFLHVWFETEGTDGQLPDAGDIASRTEGHTARVFVWDGTSPDPRAVKLGFGNPHGLPMRWEPGVTRSSSPVPAADRPD